MYLPMEPKGLADVWTGGGGGGGVGNKGSHLLQIGCDALFPTGFSSSMNHSFCYQRPLP